MQRDGKSTSGPVSFTKLLRQVHTTVDVSAVVNVDALAQEFRLSKEEQAAFAHRLQQTRKWVEEDSERLKRFHKAPLKVLGERFQDIERTIPKDLADALDTSSDSPCSNAPRTGVYNACALELLNKVAVWVGQGPGHRSAFQSDPDTAVDAVAGGAPLEAVLMVKAALRAARRYP